MVGDNNEVDTTHKSPGFFVLLTPKGHSINLIQKALLANGLHQGKN